MDLRVTGAGDDVTVPAGTTAVIGADSSATIKVARPGISRRHAVVKYDGSHWVVQDASSRNGTFHNGARIQVLDIKGPTTIRLGHPAEGTEIVLTPVAVSSKSSAGLKTPTVAAQAATPAPAQRTRVAPATKAPNTGNVDPRLDDLVASLNDTVKSIKGLTWSVWAMIAVTAVLALLTLFVGVVGN
ncbi:MAG: FHA domain-containing protein [Actinomycetota bacterium]|nr:FHA domain-containing protein [Actinomycetota bacterium]